LMRTSIMTLSIVIPPDADLVAVVLNACGKS